MLHSHIMARNRRRDKGVCTQSDSTGQHRFDTVAYSQMNNQPSPTCRTAFPAQHLRPLGILGCWPDGLELTPGFYPGSIQRAAQTVLCVYLKHTCSRVTSASSALGILSDYALYKSTHSLTQGSTGPSFGFCSPN